MFCGRFLLVSDEKLAVVLLFTQRHYLPSTGMEPHILGIGYTIHSPLKVFILRPSLVSSFDVLKPLKPRQTLDLGFTSLSLPGSCVYSPAGLAMCPLIGYIGFLLMLSRFSSVLNSNCFTLLSTWTSFGCISVHQIWEHFGNYF